MIERPSLLGSLTMPISPHRSQCLVFLLPVEEKGRRQIQRQHRSDQIDFNLTRKPSPRIQVSSTYLSWLPKLRRQLSRSQSRNSDLQPHFYTGHGAVSEWPKPSQFIRPQGPSSFQTTEKVTDTKHSPYLDNGRIGPSGPSSELPLSISNTRVEDRHESLN